LSEVPWNSLRTYILSNASLSKLCTMGGFRLEPNKRQRLEQMVLRDVERAEFSEISCNGIFAVWYPVHVALHKELEDYFHSDAYKEYRTAHQLSEDDYEGQQFQDMEFRAQNAPPMYSGLIRHARTDDVQMSLSALYFSDVSELKLWAPMIQIFPRDVMDETLDAFFLSLPAGGHPELERHYFEEMLGYRYFDHPSVASIGAYAPSPTTMKRLYAIEGYKDHFQAVMHEVRRIALDVDGFARYMGLNYYSRESR